MQQRGDRLILPKVTMSPKQVHDFRSRMKYEREGLKLSKVNDNGSTEQKFLFIDSHASRLFYSPSFKSVQQSSMSFKAIAEISTGKESTPGLRNCSLMSQKYPLTVKSEGRYLSFLLDDIAERDQLSQTLSFMVRRALGGYDEDPRNVRIYDLWIEADRDGSGELSSTEIIRVLRKMGVTLSGAEIDKLIKKFDTNDNGIEYGEFVEMYGYLTQLPILKPLFDEVQKNDGSLLEEDEMKVFFALAQGEEVPVLTIKSLMRYYTKKKEPRGISFAHFSSFIADGHKNSWIPPTRADVDLLEETKREALAERMPMDQPLHEYFIATSHNTFLTGNQYSSSSSADLIAIALQMGCRAVELEVWDGLSGDPLVFRGTGVRCKAREAIHVISESAFMRNPFPVFVICEMHCCDDQAAIFSRLLKTAFGTKLVAFDDTMMERTPRDLINHVIICYKRDATAHGDPDCFKNVEGCSALQTEVETLKNASRKSYRTVGREELAAVSGVRMMDWNPALQQESAEKVEAATEKGAPLTILQAMSADLTTGDEFAHVVREASTKTLVRVCPSMSAHSTSTNLEPSRFFDMGVSMVSLNYQSYDANLRYAEAFFQQNGGSGYVLKPDYLRASQKVVASIDPRGGGDATANADGEDAAGETDATVYTFKVTVIAGSQLPHPGGVVNEDNEVIDPYVQLAVGGTPYDMKQNRVLSTSIVDDNGFNPEWNESFNFRFTNLDFATISLQVRTRDTPAHKDIVHASAALSQIRLGYRAVPLYSSADGTRDPSAVLVCHFSLERAPAKGAGVAGGAHLEDED